MAPRVERKPKTSSRDGENFHHGETLNIAHLGPDDAKVRTSVVKVYVEQWEGGDHDEARHTKVD